MKSKRWYLSVMSAFLVVVPACLGRQRGPNWRVYKAADGLPETTITSIAVSPHGQLWVRHPEVDWVGFLDGYEVKAIPGPGPGTGRIYQSASGQIWSCTAEGLEQYRSREGAWTHFATPEISSRLLKNNLTYVRPIPLCPLKQNHVLLLLPDGLFDFGSDSPAHTQTTLVRSADQTGLVKFSNLAPARDGGLWVTGARGLAKFPGPLRSLKAETTCKEYLLPVELQIRNLREPIEDDFGGVTALAESIVSTENIRQVIAHFDGQSWTALPIAGERISLAWPSEDKAYWATSFSSLFNIKPGQKPVAVDGEASPRRYFDAAVETNGVFWLATADGLCRYAPLTWRAPLAAPGLDSAILSVTEDASGRLWVATANALHLLQNDTWTNFSFPPDVVADATETRALFALMNGTIVVDAGGRLLEFDPKTSRFSQPLGLSQTRFKALGLLKEGILCVQAVNSDASSQPAELALFDGKKLAPFPFPQPGTNSPGNPSFVFATMDGSLWLGGDNGLTWFHDKKWQNFASPAQTAPAPAAGVIEIGEGKIWCGIQDKIFEFNGKSWSSIHAGFYRVKSILKARDGSIWVAAENGSHRFYHGTWTANGIEEGLPSASVREICEDHQGRIWAGTERGLSRYHADADPDPPKTYVQNLPERNNTVPEGAIVTITFSGQDKWKYTSEDRLLFSYRLDGQEWSPYQEQRNASFLDLPAGKHSFRVRSMDRNWNVDPQPALLDFSVALPWYRESRLLFISATGFAVALFFAGLAFNRHRQLVRSYAEVEAKVALRTKQLELANQELFHSQKMNALGTLAAGIAHDFNNILSIIKGSAQIIEDNLDNEEKIRTRASRIKTVVEQGAGIVKAMLGFSRSSERHLVMCDANAIVQETITLLGDRFLREVEVKFVPAAQSLPEIPASKDLLQQILLNLIFNAAEATTERRQVILSTEKSTQLAPVLALKPASASAYVLISVKDFGSGIAPEIMPRIFEPFFTTKSLSTRRGTGLGLSMAYELARQMDCGLSVESAVGQGSIFTVILPVRDLPADSTD